MARPEPTFRIQLAAEASGVSETLIRAWERRHRVIAPARSPGGYRTYTRRDIELLKGLKRLTEEGVPIAQAVKLLPSLRREARGVSAPAVSQPRIPRAAKLKGWREGVLAAARQLDPRKIDAVLDGALAWLSPLAFFDDFAAPLVREVGDRWHAGELTVAEEHLISQAVRQRLIGLWATAPERARQHAVCACLDEEQHELGLMGAALRLRHRAWRVTFLGAGTPLEELLRVVKETHPDLIAISFVNEAGVRAQLKRLAAGLPHAVRVLVGGRGAALHRPLITQLGFEME